MPKPEFYRHGYAAVHRGIHTLSAEATAAHGTGAHAGAGSSTPARRKSWCLFAAPPKGSTWWPTAGATPGHAGDNIIISAMEHHANIVPWQML
jgi:cysteine desulfurase/selenocysteine lyase